LGLLLVLCVTRTRGTLHYPAVDFDGPSINPSDVEGAVRRTDEYFRNRVAYGSLYRQYEAQFWWCVALRRPPAVCRACDSAPALTAPSRRPLRHAVPRRPPFL
jgi:hypothetical protein